MPSPNLNITSELPTEEQYEENYPTSPLITFTSNPWNETLFYSAQEENKEEDSSEVETTEDDPYCPPKYFPLPRQTNPSRWSWIQDVIDYWRNQHGSPYKMINETSSTEPICQVTGEPTHHTIPVLVAQAHRQETAIEQLQYSMEAVPDASYWELMRHDLSTVENDCRFLRTDFEQAGMDRGRVAWLDKRLTTVEDRLDRLQASVDALTETIAYMTMNGK